MRRRVAVTGAGVISALGGTAADTWEGIVAGRTGIAPVTLFDTSSDRTHTAAQIAGLDFDRSFTPKERGRLSRGDRIGLCAALQAVADAGLDPDRLGGRRAGLLMGGGGTGLPQGEEYLRRTLAGGAPRPSSALGFFQAATADLIASRLGLRGRVQTIMNACSSSTIAIGIGASLVARGVQDLVLAGGVETLSRTTFSGFNALRLVDPDPCRPFDRERRGMSLGECAAFLLLEPLETARRRAVRVYGEVAGSGMSADAYHLTAPDPAGAGLVRSMRAALESAGVAVAEVDHINAHGTGTEQNDAAETCAIKALFGERAQRLPVASIKGAVGHCLGAAGAIEAFAALMSLHGGVIPPTTGLRATGPDCDLDFVPGRARAARLRVVLSNSSAFGGNNGTLVLRGVGP
ncbi:MAG: beta-ketoacyl-[acyl-carrier-protein] synthase family protein [Acidobacteriota bacterium]